MVNKIGDQKYYIIISLILGLMILTISLYWIFQEFFDEDELDWEVCRQSILLRASLPDSELLGLKTDVKGAFPLKCKTEVINIDDLSSPDKVYEKISDAVAEGWYMYGEGKLDFIHRDFTETQTVCLAFARIHFDEKAVGEFHDRGGGYDAWLDYAWKKYPSDVQKLTPGQIRQKGFQDYYRSNKVKNSKGTYDQYLPLHTDGKPVQSGNLIVDWTDVKFSPEDEDYLLIYRINKKSSVSGLLPARVWSKVVTFIKGEGDGIEWERYKTIAIASVDDLGVLKCNKFLTVPA